MATFTCLSHHAFKRVGQRMKLSWNEVATILNQGLFVDTGHKPGFMRHHLLFYSSVDKTCFVAIQDMHSGTVITILPLDYHKNLAWEISDDLCEQAKKLHDNFTVNQANVNQRPSTFLVSGHYLDVSGRQKTMLLLKMSSAPYKDDIGELLRDDTLPQRIDKIAGELDITSVNMYALSFRHGKKGMPVVIQLH